MTTGSATPSVTPARPGTAALERADSVLARALRLPAVGFSRSSGCRRSSVAPSPRGSPSPWILPDEILYSELAKSIADGAPPAVRGVTALGWGVVYPALVAPAWVLFDDPVTAYHAALVINALVMSSAAIAGYLLARLFVPPRTSLVVAAMTVLVPSMAYTGVVMTENAFYPLFLWTMLAIARAVRRPTVTAQLLVLSCIAVVVATRIQGFALAGAYLPRSRCTLSLGRRPSEAPTRASSCRRSPC